MQGIIRGTNWHVCDINLSRVYAKAISDWRFPITAHNGSLIRLQNRYRVRSIKLSRSFFSLFLIGITGDETFPKWTDQRNVRDFDVSPLVRLNLLLRNFTSNPSIFVEPTGVNRAPLLFNDTSERYIVQFSRYPRDSPRFAVSMTIRPENRASPERLRLVSTRNGTYNTGQKCIVYENRVVILMNKKNFVLILPNYILLLLF